MKRHFSLLFSFLLTATLTLSLSSPSTAHEPTYLKNPTVHLRISSFNTYDVSFIQKQGPLTHKDGPFKAEVGETLDHTFTTPAGFEEDKSTTYFVRLRTELTGDTFEHQMTQPEEHLNEWKIFANDGTFYQVDEQGNRIG